LGKVGGEKKKNHTLLPLLRKGREKKGGMSTTPLMWKGILYCCWKEEGWEGGGEAIPLLAHAMVQGGEKKKKKEHLSSSFIGRRRKFDLSNLAYFI